MQLLSSTELKFNQYKRECKKMQESNERNMKRLMKHRARFEELFKHRNEPEHFLFMCGFMNEYMQEFMLCHDVHIMNMQEEANPDNMTYEQLLELGESIGKVSKGISKEQFESLQRTNKVKSDQRYPCFNQAARSAAPSSRWARGPWCCTAATPTTRSASWSGSKTKTPAPFASRTYSADTTPLGSGEQSPLDSGEQPPALR